MNNKEKKLTDRIAVRLDSQTREKLITLSRSRGVKYSTLIRESIFLLTEQQTKAEENAN